MSVREITPRTQFPFDTGVPKPLQDKFGRFTPAPQTNVARALRGEDTQPAPEFLVRRDHEVARSSERRQKKRAHIKRSGQGFDHYFDAWDEGKKKGKPATRGFKTRKTRGMPDI